MMRLSCIGILALLLGSCGTGANFDGPPPPEGVIAQDTFVQVLTEVHLIEGALKQRLFRNDDSGERALSHYAELYERWGINEGRFKATYTWWYQRPEAMDALLEEVAERLTELEREIVETETDEATPNASPAPMSSRRREQ
jgi:hypothetical protein